MAIAKKSLVVFLVLVVLVLALELGIKHLSDFKVFRTQVASELAARLQADVEIDRMGLDVLPWPHLELHGLRMVFTDGTLLSVPVVNLSPTLKGLFSGRPEVVSISLEEPAVRIALREQEPEDATQTAEERRKEQGAYFKSLLQAVPLGVSVKDGIVHVTALDGRVLAVEDIAAEAVATPRGLRISADCTSALWKQLTATLIYHDPKAILKIDGRDIDIEKTDALITSFAGDELPAEDIRQNLKGLLSSVSFTINIPRVSELSENVTTSGRGSFENIDVIVPDPELELRELAGDFELDSDSISLSNINARVENSLIQDAAVHLDAAREFEPKLITADITLDLADVPGFLHLIPDPDVRDELALIKNPTGIARAKVEVRAEEESYSTQVVLDELRLKSNYRNFPSTLELRRGTCAYKDEVLSLKSFSGKLGSSVLPDFSLSFSFRDDEHFTAAARGGKIVFGDLRMVLDSYDESQELIENISAKPDGRMTIQALAFEGPLTKPENWTIVVDALLDDVSIVAVGIDGSVAIDSGVLKANENSCAMSGLRLRYRDAELQGEITLDGYFDGINAAAGDIGGMLGEKVLDEIQALIDMPSVLALRPPVKIERSRLEWSRDGAVTVVGDFVLGGKSNVGLKLRADDSLVEIEELKIRDAASQCKLGVKIEKDLFSVVYAGMLRKETLDRVLLSNRFMQGWVKGDISVTFDQKNPRGSSAKGTLAWEKVGFPAFDSLPITLTSAELKARDRLLTVNSAGFSAGPDSAGVQGSIDFTDDGFVLDLALEAESIDVDALMDCFLGDNATDDSSAEEFWETPLRGTVRFRARELTKGSFACNPFEALVSFDDRAVTIDTGGTKLCTVDLPATVLITPEAVTLDARAKAIEIPVEGFEMCLYGGDDFITGRLDIDAAVHAQAAPHALLDSLDGEFTISARDGRIYRSGLIAKIVSYLSISNLLKLSVSDMMSRGYAYQSLDIAGVVKGQTLEIGRGVLISDSFTLVCTGTIDLKSEQVDLHALVTPFQIHNQILSKIPLVNKVLGKPRLGVPLKIDGSLGDLNIRTRTASAVHKGLVDITKGIINAPIKLIRPIFPKKSSEEQ